MTSIIVTITLAVVMITSTVVMITSTVVMITSTVVMITSTVVVICLFVARCIDLDKDIFRISPYTIMKGLCPEFQLEVYYPGFPIFKHISHTVRVFRFRLT